MESDDDLHPSSSSPEDPLPVPRKLKRLKRAIRVSHDPDPKQSDGGSVSPEANSSPFESQNSESNHLHSSLGSEDFSLKNVESFKESDWVLRSRSGSEDFDSENLMDFGYTGLGGEEGGSGAKRALDFGNVDEKREEEDGVRRNEVEEESHNEELDVSEKKRHSSDGIEEEQDKEDEEEEERNKKRRVDSGFDDRKLEKAAKNKRRAEKERRDHLKQLHSESQRLLRESRNATFETVPLVQKPISSLLEKIRQRKLEISKNRRPAFLSDTSFIDNDDGDSEDLIVEHNSECAHTEGGECSRVLEAVSKETISHSAEVESNIGGAIMDGYNSMAMIPVSEKDPSQALNKESKQAFRVPVDDTQDLFSDTQTSEYKDEILDEMPISSLEEALAPSVLTMNLKLDSAPPDDVSSDDEDNDKENTDPRQHGPINLSTSSNGDPVKAFVDDEAEEEDNSDNDILCFQENDEDEDEDLEELNDMIATGYEEKPIDAERRNELHQKWLEQQDEAGTETLLQKFKHSSELHETTCLEEEYGGGEEDEESEDGAAEDSVPRNEVQMNLRKIKQMIPQMYTDNDNGYLSSDDEEKDNSLAKHCLIEKVEAQSTFLSPAEDESCKDIFGLIKKLNIVPDTKKKAKIPGRFDMPVMGGKGNISSKSSFLGRGSSQSLPSSRKRGSITSRSFIFGTEDSNSRSTISTAEDSSETIQRENRPRIAPAKFNSSQSQTKGSTQSSAPASVVKSNTSLIEILRKTSLKSKSFIQESAVTQTETVLASFKLAKKTVKTREDPIVYTRT